MEITGTANPPVELQYTDDAFEQLFKLHFKALHAYATVMLRDESAAEEIVQQVFLKLWEKRARLSIEISVKAYLYKCVHNDSLNYIAHLKTRSKYTSYATHSLKGETGNASHRAELNELEQHLSVALNELPQQCRTIFQMSRFEELKYKEIADQLGISIKTVENQMGKALRILRLKLVDFLPLLIWLLYNDNC